MSLKKNTAHILDPVLFANDCLDFQADHWQAQVLRSTGKDYLLLCSRQSGKSTTTAIKALHRILFFPDSLVLIVAPSIRQASELFRKLSDFLNVLSEPPKKLEDNKLSVTLMNGSRACALPSSEATVRGFSSPSLVIFDEAARVGDSLYYAMRPMIAVSGGEIIALSTPYGKRGWFYEAYTTEQTWEKITVKAEDCPRISPEFLAREREIHGNWFYRQEYDCEFTQTEESFFSPDLIEKMFQDLGEPLKI